MNSKTLLLIVCALGLVGCSAMRPAAPATGHLPWHDQVFNLDASLVSISKQTLFALDRDLLATLDKARMEKLSQQARFDYLLKLLYGAKNETSVSEFPYEGGRSTIATETWRRKRGDCLSLVVMAYSLAEAMDLSADMQEVPVPYTFDRHGGIDYVAGHVNLRIKNRHGLQIDERAGIGDITIDFQPQIGSQRAGTALSEDGILARFYNNLGAQYLAKDKLNYAYAHFKAAIMTDAAFAPSYVNLAVLYKRLGLTHSAETLLARAIALSDDEIAMDALHQLLVVQGRDAEARPYAKLIEARREKNPYYWIGLGIDQLQKQNYPQAVSALENAQARSNGFPEVHRYLALAYLRNGNQAEAKKQIALLATLIRDGSSDAAWLNKLKKLSLN